MNPRTFAVSLRRSAELWAQLDLILALRSTASLVASERFRREARSQDYLRVYRVGLEERAYNFLLTDFGYLQFSYSALRHGYGVRYAYYPNPYSGMTLSEFEAHRGEPDADSDVYEEFVRYLQDQHAHHARPAVRYDIAFGDYRELAHPCAHLHFGTDGDNRWPVAIEMTPLTFSFLVAKMFYPAEWARIGGAADSTENPLEVRYSEAKAACQSLSEQYFSRRERSQPHLA